MKRLLAVLLVLALCMGCASAEESGVEKYDESAGNLQDQRG